MNASSKKSNRRTPERVVWTVPELATVLGISRGSAYRLANSDQLRTVRIGRSIRIPREAVEDFLGMNHSGADRQAS